MLKVIGKGQDNREMRNRIAKRNGLAGSLREPTKQPPQATLNIVLAAHPTAIPQEVIFCVKHHFDAKIYVMVVARTRPQATERWKEVRLNPIQSFC
jgi:hypothetical protein